MEELLKLLGLVDDARKEEAKKLVDAVNERIKKADEKITEQERIKLDAIKSRDEAKKKLKDIALKLGVKDGEDLLEALENIKGKEDEVKDREIEALKEEVQNLTSNLEAVEAETESKLMDISLEKDLAMVLPKYKAVGKLVPYLMNEIKSKAKFEDGKVKFINEDGTTVRVNGKDATLDDMVKLEREKEVKEGTGVFFDISVQDSGAGEKGGVAEGDFIP